MKLAIPTLMSRLNEARRVECDGFYDGAHGTPVETGIKEIDSKFEEKKANLQKVKEMREQRPSKRFYTSLLERTGPF